MTKFPHFAQHNIINIHHPKEWKQNFFERFWKVFFSCYSLLDFTLATASTLFFFILCGCEAKEANKTANDRHMTYSQMNICLFANFSEKNTNFINRIRNSNNTLLLKSVLLFCICCFLINSVHSVRAYR